MAETLTTPKLMSPHTRLLPTNMIWVTTIIQVTSIPTPMQNQDPLLSSLNPYTIAKPPPPRPSPSAPTCLGQTLMPTPYRTNTPKPMTTMTCSVDQQALLHRLPLLQPMPCLRCCQAASTAPADLLLAPSPSKEAVGSWKAYPASKNRPAAVRSSRNPKTSLFYGQGPHTKN